MTLELEISNRHIHLSPKDADALFGENYVFKKLKDLSQRGQYSCEETVAIVGPKGKFEHVRVLGPHRGDTQIEISRTDAFALGIDVPLRISGDLKETPEIKIVGSHGELVVPHGTIVAKRHVHLCPQTAQQLSLVNGAIVKVVVESGERKLVFGEVVVRIHETFVDRVHFDMDEANAAWLVPGMKGEIICT